MRLHLVDALTGIQEGTYLAVAAHGMTIVGWSLRLRWQARHRRDPEDLLALLRELPAGSSLETTRPDGTVLRVELSDADEYGSDDGR